MDKIYKAIADFNRRKIIEILVEKEVTVTEMSKILDMRQSTLSSHLAILRSSGLVKTRVNKRWRIYFLNIDLIKDLVKDLNRISGMDSERGNSELILRKKV